MDLSLLAAALREIDQARLECGPEANEAETRVTVIDQVLERVLGWPRSEFHPEEYAGIAPATGKKAWIDYHLGSVESVRLVVEAKRTGKTFTLSAKKCPRTVPLQELRDHHGSELNAALSQAQKYCRQVGTPGFVVTNGHQWIASLIFVPGLPEANLQAVVYYSLEDILTDLRQFVDLFSPQGVGDQNLCAKAALTMNVAPSFAKALNDVLFPAAPRMKNYLVNPLRLVMRECFGELTGQDQIEMLAECYVSSDSGDENLRVLEAFACPDSPQYLPANATRLRRDLQGSSTLVDQAAVGSTVLVVGRAGSGKSTFLAMTRYRIESAKKSETLVLNVDLRERTETHAQTFNHDRMIDDVCRDLLIEARNRGQKLDPFERANLEEIFSGEIERLRVAQKNHARSGPEFDAKVNTLIENHTGNPLWHLKAYLGFLSKREIAVLILLDNVDRGTREFEMVTSKLADQLAKNTSTSVAVCMRETTYNGGNIGFLDVRRQNVLMIAPPPFGEVARRRFEFARKRLLSDQKLHRRLLAALNGTPLDRVQDFAEIMADMVLGDDSELRDCISALSGTNIRSALRYLEQFSVSAHTDLDALFRQYEHKRRSHVTTGLSLDTFLQSIMRGDSQRYRERDHGIINLFQVSPGRRISHFLAVRILQLLEWHTRQSHERIDMQVSDVFGRLGALGYPATDTLATLNRLGKRHLVGSLSKPEPEWQHNDTVRIATAGRYYLKVLLTNRAYISNVVDDTIIYDEQTFRGLEQIDQDKNVSWPQRSDEKARLFLAYLARAERQEAPLTNAGALPAWFSFVAEDIGIKRFGPQFREMLQRPRRHRPRR